ncbi:mammalian cell entry protein [Mycobacterium sp. SM1]|uniref:mammalian cell entry protein n=1 Tax=Mycobacterium sp. SM1 TaxID=2816243 RepID=UPI001BCB5FE0|nr:mammalian cell entry protein [Mycobacterium sp. SM1]MBS4727848.1 mammalian cell entry protein [Mycobacterium sp. SM1]
MEDQQSAASDLTDKTSDIASAADAAHRSQAPDTGAWRVESPAPEAESTLNTDENNCASTQSIDDALDDADATQADGITADGATDEAGAAAEQDDGVARNPVRKRVAIAVGAAAALFVGSAAFAGATVQPYLADEATVATKINIARTAANAVTTLWTYTPDNLDKLPDRAATYLSGDFEAQYRKFIDAIAPANKQAKITNNTQVVAAAVESLNGPEAVAIVYTNTTSTSPVTKGVPSLKYLSYRLFMKRDHARWRVTRMTTITSLDLTPRV